jgi:hypothetical protein
MISLCNENSTLLPSVKVVKSALLRLTPSLHTRTGAIPTGATMTQIQLFKSKTKIGKVPKHMKHLGRCLNWTGQIATNGYGVFFADRFSYRAHRWHYEYHNGKIKKGLLCCHKCDNPRCVKRNHLFIGSQSKNMLDCSAKGRLKNQHLNKTHCKNGHEFSGDNLIFCIRSGKIFRRCGKCHLAWAKIYYEKKKSKRAASSPTNKLKK